MCGILGIISPHKDIKQMQDALVLLKQRGPDGEGIFDDEGILLGHTRLAIQDLGALAAQPMTDTSGRYVIVYNGEIYNHLDLREKLINQGVHFQTHSDTETLLYGFIHYGEAIVDQLNGMFAFAILDKKSKKLFLARDRSGIKPLYYYQDKDCFVFGSEIKPILQLSGCERKVNYNALYETLLLQWPLNNKSSFEHIQPLEQGHSLQLSTENIGPIHCKKWAKRYDSGKFVERQQEDWVHLTKGAIAQSIERQLLSDRPIGFFLSGGVDSSLLYAMAQEQHHKGFDCFCIDSGTGFEWEGFGRDIDYAQKVVAQYGGQLHAIPGRPDILEGIDEMIYRLEEPLADTAPLFVTDISQQAAALDIPVLISGTGADDIFSGYRRHQALHWFSLLDKTPRIALRAGTQILKYLPEGALKRRALKLFKSAISPQNERLFQLFLWTSQSEALQILHKDIQEKIAIEACEAFFENSLNELPHQEDQLNQLLYLEQHSFLPAHNLLYTDKMGMASGVEIRVPYLDNDLMQLVAGIPGQLKMKGPQSKYLLKQVAKEYLPTEIIQRKKTGFGAPIRHWLQHEPKSQVFFRERIGQLGKTGLINKAYTERLLTECIDGKQDKAYTLLALVCIESWYRQFIQSS